MLYFNPPELKEQIANAINVWVNQFNFLDTLVDLTYTLESPVDLIDDNFDPAKYSNKTIDSKTTLGVGLPYWNEIVAMSYQDFIDLVDELQSTRLIKNTIYRSKYRSLIRVKAINDRASSLVHHIYNVNNKIFQSKPQNLTKFKKILRNAVSNIKLELDDEFIQIISNNIKNQSIKNEEETKKLKEEMKFYNQFYVSNTNIDGIKVSYSLTSGFTICGAMLALEEKFTTGFSSVGSDVFVELKFEQPISESIEKDILQAYLFELSSTLGIDFEVFPFFDNDDIWVDEDELKTYNTSHILRPLLLGRNMSDVLELYNQAIASIDPHVQILYFTKVIEYVSQTVIKMQFNDAVRAKLLSPRALQPDANFISELEKVIEKQQSRRKDREAIKETVLTCCEASELAKVAPPFLKKLKAISSNSNEEQISQALRAFSASLYSTRNSIAHAKANYIPTNDECPERELLAFSNCAKLAAQQVIRWYNFSSEINKLS
ncbi:hypothetical protein [Scytonema sp. PRP1]|uniref:hypothetical protein n=1 Tax=Scytonema sp. PRP1 TaxID=3120513 RepID=UPI00300C7AB7